MSGRSLTSLCLSLPPPVLPEVDKQKISVAEPTATSSLLLVHIVFSLVFHQASKEIDNNSVHNVCGKRCNKMLTYGERTLAAVV